jgi:DNA-binding transcriptional ArsR family regulator
LIAVVPELIEFESLAGRDSFGADIEHSTNLLNFPRPANIFSHMVNQQMHLDSVFRALGDATRRRMLRALADGEHTVGELAEPFSISLAAASKHIKVLESAGLIRREVRGRTHLCRLDTGPLASANAWLTFYERFWTGRLDALEKVLREKDSRKSPAPKKGTSS